jgi:hypothetical protein
MDLTPQGAVLIAGLAVLVFLPTIIAIKRDHGKKWLVALANVLTAWTGVGWVVALAWAIRGASSKQQDLVEKVVV